MSPNLEWSCQRCTKVVVPVYRMLPWGGGWGNVWLKNNVVPTLGQDWDFASIDNHYTNIIRVPKVYTLLLPLLLNKMCSFRYGYTMKKFNLIKFKMADLRPLLTSIGLCVITVKPCQIARPLLFNKMCGFKWGYTCTLKISTSSNSKGQNCGHF